LAIEESSRRTECVEAWKLKHDYLQRKKRARKRKKESHIFAFSSIEESSRRTECVEAWKLKHDYLQRAKRARKRKKEEVKDQHGKYRRFALTNLSSNKFLINKLSFTSILFY